MGERSRLWLLAAGLLAAGAALEAAAVALHWRPCGVEEVSGSTGARPGSEPSVACLTAMEEASSFFLPQPGAGWTVIGSLGAGAAILLAVAWLVLLPTLRLSASGVATAALPGVLGITASVNAVVVSSGPAFADDAVGPVLAVLREFSVAIALVTLAAAGVSGMLLARYAIVALVATSAGLFHQMTEYLVAMVVSNGHWDVPPGTGYLTVALCLGAAVATGVLWWRAGHAQPVAPQPSAPVPVAAVR